MNEREKLIQILRVPIFPHELADPTEVVADYLLDNDVVPVVRCKDCKKFVQMGDTPMSRVCIRTGGLSMAKPNDFCSYGERRTDG